MHFVWHLVLFPVAALTALAVISKIQAVVSAGFPCYETWLVGDRAVDQLANSVIALLELGDPSTRSSLGSSIG